jgi:PAS domain S-box-containing protein
VSKTHDLNETIVRREALNGSVDRAAFEQLLELIGPYLETTPDGTITEANTAASALFRFATRLLIGKPLSILIPAGERRDMRRRMARAAREAGPQRFVARFQRDGIAFDAEVALVASRLRSTGGPGLRWVVQDISEGRVEHTLWELNEAFERRIGERTNELEVLSGELQRQRADLEAVVHHIPAGILIADATTGSVTLANDQARQLAAGWFEFPTNLEDWGRRTGFRADGSPLGPDEWPLVRALGGETVIGERVMLPRKDGSTLMLDLSAAPVLDAMGEVVAAVSLFQDVTEQERRRRAASEFIANAAHELRTPLAAIVSGVDVLEGGAKYDPAERDRFLTHIGREAGRLARLTRALLLLARIQSGNEAPRLEIVELAPLLREVAGSLRPATAVKVSVRCSTSVAALANRGLLEQALTSVAGNAARYTDRGRIVLSAGRPRGEARIRIRDTGRGMSADEVLRAGERFFRGQDSGAGGFGLGLSIARQAIEVMGGRMTLTSEPEVGTTVVIDLPGAELLAG